MVPRLDGIPPGHGRGHPNEFPQVPTKYRDDDSVETASTLYLQLGPVRWSLNKWHAPCAAGSHVA